MEITRGKTQSAIKTVIYGPEGIGKSTLASKFPDALFIDTEGSTKHMDVARLPNPSSFAMLIKAVKYVIDNPTCCKTLVIDTVDWAETLCITDFCAAKQLKGIEDIGYGKGYIYIAEEFGRLLNLLNDVIDKGINVVLTAHAKMRKFEQPDELGAYDRWELKLQKKIAPMVKEWADMVLFANYKTLVVNVDNLGANKGKNKAQGGKRVMYTTHHVAWDAKNRFGLDDELEFNFNEIAHLFNSFSNHRINDGIVEIKPQTTMITPEIHTPAPAQIHIENTELNDIPGALLDLMKLDNVSIDEIKEVVALKGYYPINTPIKNYDKAFIDGVLISAWAQVLELIKIERNKKIDI